MHGNFLWLAFSLLLSSLVFHPGHEKEQEECGFQKKKKREKRNKGKETKKEKRNKKRSTGPSRVVPHRSTTLARTCLTSLFGWEAVSQADMAALKAWLEMRY